MKTQVEARTTFKRSVSAFPDPLTLLLGERNDRKIRQIGIGVELEDDRIGRRSIDVQKHVSGEHVGSKNFAFEKNFAHADMPCSQDPSRTQIDDGRSFITTLGNIFPIRKISWAGIFGFGVGASENECESARLAHEPEGEHDRQPEPNASAKPGRVRCSYLRICS